MPFPIIDPDDLPVVLAGPQLRRLTRDQVAVWLALGVDTGPLRLWIQTADTLTAYDEQPGRRVRLGAHLWVAVLTADGVFEAGETHSYWVTTANDNLIGGLELWESLAYEGNRPAFIGLPTALEDLAIVHGSCRKPHGPGPDGMALGDRLVVEDGVRPHLLVLSGDQIYADDVSGLLLPVIRSVDEVVVARGESHLFPDIDIIDDRGEESADAGFTSSTAANHLWTLGEFLAMYLLVWSDALWPADLDVPQAIGPDAEANADLEAEWDAQRAKLVHFRDELPRVRRLLANVPTLMIFDDHEVSDDWNLNQAWARGLYAGGMGPRVVTNALLAYLVCQHWGNVPTRFDLEGSPERLVLAAIGFAQAGASNPVADDPLTRMRLGVPTLPTLGPDDDWEFTAHDQRIRYDFAWEPGPDVPVRAVFLDERTLRLLPAHGPPARVSPAALDLMLPPATPETQATPLLVVAAAPVAGLPLVEHLVQPAAGFISPELADLDGWSGHTESWMLLVQRLSTFDRPIVLSGDVHYGYTRTLRLDDDGPTIAQFTCSALRKGDVLTVGLHWLGEGLIQIGAIRGRTIYIYTAAQESLTSLPDDAIMLPWSDVLDVVFGRVARAGVDPPFAVSNEVAEAWDLPPPDHVVELRMRDMFAPATPATQAAAAQGTWNGWQPQRSVDVVRGLRDALLDRTGRVLVGVSQVGLLSFEPKANGDLHVRQTIHYGVHGLADDLRRAVQETWAEVG